MKPVPGVKNVRDHSAMYEDCSHIIEIIFSLSHLPCSVLLCPKAAIFNFFSLHGMQKSISKILWHTKLTTPPAKQQQQQKTAILLIHSYQIANFVLAAEFFF